MHHLSKATTFKHNRDVGLMEKARTPVNATTHVGL